MDVDFQEEEVDSVDMVDLEEDMDVDFLEEEVDSVVVEAVDLVDSEEVLEDVDFLEEEAVSVVDAVEEVSVEIIEEMNLESLAKLL